MSWDTLQRNVKEKPSRVVINVDYLLILNCSPEIDAFRRDEMSGFQDALRY